MRPFKKIFSLLNLKERKHANVLITMMIIMALLDMLGIASIMPFISVLSNPNIIDTNFFLNKFFEILKVHGVSTKQEFLFILGGIIFSLLIFSLIFKALLAYMQIKFIQITEYNLCRRLLESYLRQPYTWFLSRNSAELGKSILSEVGQVVIGGLRPVMEVISKGLITFAIITLLIVIDTKLSLIVGFSITLAYIFIFFCFRSIRKKSGQERILNNKLRFVSVSEAFGAIKEIKIGGIEKIYIQDFSNAAKSFAKNSSIGQIISQLPRFFLEAIAFGGILIIILLKMDNGDGFNKVLPIVGLYAFAGYRLIPAIQQIYASYSQISFNSEVIKKLENDLYNLKPEIIYKKKNLSFNKSIDLKNVSFNYSNSSKKILDNINISLPARATIGFIGRSGSGKTTLIDVILGLLTLKNGVLEVDGIKVSKYNLSSWQSMIGYVPQHIYLTDNTIKSNIAFGINKDHIDQKMVERVSQVSNLHDFIINDLPEGYDTIVGERGVRLSGGQRQRIGIARALYNNPRILILDEATSALDNQTEKAVMDAINNLKKKITIIIVAHRLDTIKNCDTVYTIKNGKII